jgi:tripartite-type tricarboxylate transporter receptor subunit TctC
MTKLWRRILALLVAVVPLAAAAQSYPDKPVRIVVPYPPGGGVDVLARAIAAELTGRWGQTVIVDNRGGAESIIGADVVAKAPADGYTLMMTINQTFTTNPFVRRSLPYDPDKSFVPVSNFAQGGILVLAHPSLPVKNLRELVAYARKEPGKLNYAGFGNASLAFELLKKREGLNVVQVPYKGINPALQAILAGDIQVIVVSAGSVMGSIKAGKLRPLAIAAKERSSLFPDVPTSREEGYGYMQAGVWMGMFAPAGTPRSVIDKLHADTTAIVRVPDFSAKHISALGWDVVANTPNQFAGSIREEMTVMGEMFRALDIKPE